MEKGPLDSDLAELIKARNRQYTLIAERKLHREEDRENPIRDALDKLQKTIEMSEDYGVYIKT